MAYWSTPVIDREYGSKMTVTDMNRITNNINYLAEHLAEHSLYFGPKVSKTEWIHNDYVTLDQWKEILTALDSMVLATYIDIPAPGTEETTYENINNVETIILLLRERMDLLMGLGALNHYADTEVWTGDDVNAGGIQDPETNPYRRLRHYCDTELYCGEPANAGGVK